MKKFTGLPHRNGSNDLRDKPPLARDDEVAQRAITSMQKADRWLHAAMEDADRVFKRGSKTP